MPSAPDTISETLGLYFIVQLPRGYMPSSTEKFICERRLKCLRTCSSESSGSSTDWRLTDRGTWEAGSLNREAIFGSRGTARPVLPGLLSSLIRGSFQKAWLNRLVYTASSRAPASLSMSSTVWTSVTQ